VSGPASQPERNAAFLEAVTGEARYCAPCAWSALTGLPSTTWPDRPMTDFDEYAVLERLRFKHGFPWYVDDLPDRLVGVALRDFHEPGRWALTVRWDDDEEQHAVAVAVHRLAGHGTHRVLADNHVRIPATFEAVLAQHEPYRTAVVAGGFRLVPDEPMRFGERGGT